METREKGRMYMICNIIVYFIIAYFDIKFLY